ncbi:MAG: DNA gyrase subunit A [Clostridia bacterium]|nr:DNA gyrase subunit A [Clostridia bacterium]
MKKRDYKTELENLVDNTNYKVVEVAEEMKQSFIEYAMTVNVSRAIPDIRDGLKPVHRRILFSMGELNLFSDKPYLKCARIVGDVLGKYHPHGDSSVYDALVRLAQDFSINHPLVDGHGNFGSVDGDPPAAYRYTEARLSKISSEMLRDIDKETVSFYPNFDDSLMQPTVLPARFPNLLVNGSDGIAVGMATNIPPHNLGEVIDGVVALIKNPDITIDELISIIPAPDYPTGGLIMGRTPIVSAYKTGRGGVVIRARSEIEELENGKSRIVVTELPYQVNKAKLIEHIADLVKDKRVEGIADIKEESDRHGLRIVIEVKKDYQPQVVLNMLYKHTALQVKNGIIFLALVNGTPKICNLKEMLYYYLEHQKEVITNRVKYDLNKAEERMHIVYGLCIALDNIDEVIAIIKASKEKNEAMVKLMERFGLSEKQSNAILEMRLQRLTGLEADKLKQELEELKALIADLKDILNNPQRLLSIIETEITEIKEKYKEERKSEISINFDDIDIADLIEKEDVIISLTNQGYVKRTAVSEYRTQRRGGVGITAHKTKEEDFVKSMFVSNTHDDLLIFTNLGKVYQIKAYEVPEAQRQAKGRAMVNLLNLMPEERVNAIIRRKEDDTGALLMATRGGLIKKTDLKEFESIRKNGKIAITLREGDELVGVVLTKGDDNILIGATSGKCINFNVKDVRQSGRSSQGVKSMNLVNNEQIVDLTIIEEGKHILTITEKGYGKRSESSEYREQSRGGKGTKAGKFNEKTGNLVCLRTVSEDEDIILITDSGVIIRTPASDVRIISRATSGVKIMRVADDAKIVSVGIVEHEEEVEEMEGEVSTNENALVNANVDGGDMAENQATNENSTDALNESENNNATINSDANMNNTQNEDDNIDFDVENELKPDDDDLN